MKDDEILKICARIDRKGKKHDQFIGDAYKRVDLVNQYLNPCGDDLILITLKGHLIIENLLGMILTRLLDIESLPGESESNRKKEDKLEFNQKLQLVQAVVIARDPKPNADLFCAIAKLNSIRNSLAHKLMNSGEIEGAVKSILESYQSKADMKLSSDKPLPEQLKLCIGKLCKFLVDVRYHFYKLEQKEDD